MPQMVFRVVGLAIAPNLRGVEMRRLQLSAVDGEAFAPTETPPDTPSAPPDGLIDVLVTADYIKAKKLALGDLATVDIQEQ
jgi:hypothetical protein